METTNEPPGDRSGPPHGESPDERPPRESPPRTRAGSGADPKSAGFLIVAAIIFLGGIGLGFGALVGAPAPFALAGLFGGLILGFRLVYSRFKDI